MIETAGIRAHWAALSADPVRRLALARARAAESAGRTEREPVREVRALAGDPGQEFRRPVLAAAPVTPAAGAAVYLYGEVGWEIRAEDVAAQLATVNGDATAYISSPGGDVWEGLTCYNVLRRHPGQLTVVVDGLAASAASFIAQAASPGQLFMSPGSMMMCHEAWAFAGGPASELRATAALLDKATLSIAEIYAERSGRPAADWLAMMRDETWFSDQEAVAALLADAVAGAAVSPAGNDDAVLGDNEFAMIANILRGQLLMASADPDGPRGQHPDGTPVTKAERRAAFEAYARARAARKSGQNGRAFNAAHPDGDVSPFVKRMFGLD
jgi:ATP-dependent protease ClpP protease subunit